MAMNAGPQATDQPNFTQLHLWHYEEHRNADLIRFGTWAEAMKKLVMRDEDGVTSSSWPFGWIFPHEGIHPETDTASFFDAKHPRLAYRLGYTYQMLCRYISRLGEDKSGYDEDKFLSQANPHGGTNYDHIVKFIKRFRDNIQERVGFDEDEKYEATEEKLGRFETCFLNKTVPDYNLIVVPTPLDDAPLFIQGLGAAKANIQAVELLLKENKSEELKNFRVDAYPKHGDPRAKKGVDGVKRARGLST